MHQSVATGAGRSCGGGLAAGDTAVADGAAADVTTASTVLACERQAPSPSSASDQRRMAAAADQQVPGAWQPFVVVLQ
jgi:hypothetical protein